MDTAELQLLTSLEDHHWWYRERRAILRRELRRLPGPGRALDIGAAGGGNTRVLKVSSPPEVLPPSLVATIR